MIDRRCSVHAEPEGDALDAWPCPDDCLEFLDELERQIEDVKINGNFTRVWQKDGLWYRQTFRNHQPVGELQVSDFGRPR
jgi:hypothetical protein